MFVRYFATIPRPLEECRQLLLQEPQEWLPHLVESALRPGEELVSRMGFSILALPLRKRAIVQLGRPLTVRDWLHIPISWEARPASEVFPRFEGEIQLVPIDPDVTKVAVAGTYDPPLGDVGRAVDTLLLHTAAEATVKDFVDGLARRAGRATRLSHEMR